MGKSNRIRSKRANAALVSSAKPVKKEGMPSWAINLITIAVSVVILLSVVVSLIAGNGVFMRMQTAMETENYSVNANVMNYFFRTAYNNFLSQNSTYVSYLGLDTTKSLKEQFYLGDVKNGTWFDNFMNQARTEVKTMLVLCEEANKRGIKLEESELEVIDAEIQMYELYASIYGYSTNSYIASVYGQGMKVKDVRAALELSALASKCSAEVSEEILESITGDQVDAEYEANKDDYDLADYAYYSFTVTYKEACTAVLGAGYKDADIEPKKDEILAKYKELIADAKAKAEELAAKTDFADFKGYIIDKAVNDAFDAAYEEEITDGDLTKDALPSDENVKTIKEKAIAHLIEIITAEKDYEKLVKEADGKHTLFDIEISHDYEEAFEAAMESAIDAAITDIESFVVEGGKFDDTKKPIEWAFEEGENGRKPGDIKLFEEGDGADGKEFGTDLKTFTVSTYYAIKPRYRDESLTKNLGLGAFASEADAKEAIKKLTKDMTIEEFEKVCEDLKGTFAEYENYSKGSLGVAAFDTWLYAEDTVKGAFTATPIKMGDSSYAVAIYVADGEAEWYVDVQNTILNDTYTELLEEYEKTYPITVKDKVINRIDA